MIVMRVRDNYRILFDGEHLPVEIPQEELNGYLNKLSEAVNTFRCFLSDSYEGDETKYEVLKEIMNRSCVDYQDGKNWKLEDINYEVEQMLQYLETTKDAIPSFEESETIQDYGFHEEWRGSGVFEKKLENTDEREVVEELLLHGDEFMHRKRTIVWEQTEYGKSSKEIIYEDLPLDDNLLRLLNNSKIRMRNMGAPLLR